MEIKLTENQEEVLRHWASVSRTLKESQRLVDILVAQNLGSPEALMNLEELEALTQPLDALHSSWRNEINKFISERP